MKDENREEARARRQEAVEACKRFEEENKATFARWKEMKRAIDDHSWPPPGHEECSWEGEGDGEDCSAVFPKGPTPEGWVEIQHSCGCGGSGSFCCPAHAKTEYVEEGAGRCSYCHN